jgi:hypothetical protein
VAKRAALGVLLFVFASAPSRAQVTHSLALTVGASQYDFGITGTASIVALRWEMRLRRALIVEPGMARVRYGPSGYSQTLWFPETTIQVQVPGPVQPFMGAGVGVAFGGSTRTSGDLTLLVVAGLRVRVVDRCTLRAELRYREVDPRNTPPSNLMADWVGGVSFRL